MPPPRRQLIPDLALETYFDFHEKAIEHGVEYLVVGAATLTFQKLSRSTDDIDLWVKPGEENLRRLYDALTDLGYKNISNFMEGDLMRPQKMHIAGPIDLLTTIHQQYDFDTCFARRTVLELEGHVLPVLHLIDVRDLKVRAKRDQDLRDVIIIDNFLREHNMLNTWQ